MSQGGIDNGVHQLGVVTPGNVAVFNKNNLLQDGGGPPAPTGPQTANFVFAGPPTAPAAAPAFRHLVAPDINGIAGITLPDLTITGQLTGAGANFSGIVNVANQLNGIKTSFANFVPIAGIDTGINVNTGGAAGILNLVYAMWQNGTGNHTGCGIYMVRFGFDTNIITSNIVKEDFGGTSTPAGMAFSVTGGGNLFATPPVAGNCYMTIQRVGG